MVIRRRDMVIAAAELLTRVPLLDSLGAEGRAPGAAPAAKFREGSEKPRPVSGEGGASGNGASGDTVRNSPR